MRIMMRYTCHDAPDADLLSGLRTDFFHTVSSFQTILMRAMFGWAVWVVPASFLLYAIHLPLMRRAIQGQARAL